MGLNPELKQLTFSAFQVYQDPGISLPRWNAVMYKVIKNTCSFPAMMPKMSLKKV